MSDKKEIEEHGLATEEAKARELDVDVDLDRLFTG